MQKIAPPLILSLLIPFGVCAAESATPPADGVWRDTPRAKDAIRVLVVTGGHEHDTSFYSVFEGYPDIAAAVRPHPAALIHDLRKGIQVLVLYDMVRDLEPEKQKVLQQFAEAGKGIVVMHHALADYLNWPWWAQNVSGAHYIFDPGPDGKKSSYKHDEILDVRPVGQHPVIDGIGPFKILDETYKDMWFSPKIQVLLQTDNPTSDDPVAWIGPCTTSRTVCIQLGHDRNAHGNPAFRKLVRNAILWTAGK